MLECSNNAHQHGTSRQSNHARLFSSHEQNILCELTTSRRIRHLTYHIQHLHISCHSYSFAYSIYPICSI